MMSEIEKQSENMHIFIHKHINIHKHISIYIIYEM